MGITGLATCLRWNLVLRETNFTKGFVRIMRNHQMALVRTLPMVPFTPLERLAKPLECWVFVAERWYINVTKKGYKTSHSGITP